MLLLTTTVSSVFDSRRHPAFCMILGSMGPGLLPEKSRMTILYRFEPKFVALVLFSVCEVEGSDDENGPLISLFLNYY